MIPLHIDCAGDPAAVAFQNQAPRRPADAGHVAVDGGRRQRFGAPARGGGARLCLVGLAQKNAHHAGAGAEGEAAGGGEIEEARRPLDLGEHRRQATAGEALLGDPQRVERPADVDDDQAARIEPQHRQATAIRHTGFVARCAFGDPQDGARIGCGERGKDGDGKAGGGAVVPRQGAADFMQRVAAEATGEQPVEVRNAEREKREVRLLPILLLTRVATLLGNGGAQGNQVSAQRGALTKPGKGEFRRAADRCQAIGNHGFLALALGICVPVLFL